MKIETEQITICLPDELLQKLKQEAERKGYTNKDLIMFILWENLENTVQE